MLISMTQVTKAYPMGESIVRAVDDVSLEVETGEFIGIWGPSGSGKTTLLNLMGAVDIPTSGQIQVNGHDLSRLSDNRCSCLRNRFIGFVFQRYNLIPVMSAVENVMVPLQIQGLPANVARQKALSRLDIVGLSCVAHQRPDKMSGGQQQRVAVARALVTDPLLVLADEPTANLDSDTSLRLIALMREINQQLGTTFVFSTHDQRLLDHVQRRIWIQDGRILSANKEVS